MRTQMTILAVALVFGIGTALADPDKDESGKSRERAEKRDKKWEKEQEKRLKEEEKRIEEREKRREKERDREEKRSERDRDSYFARNGYERLSIPKGHYPPPGMCRAWYPDRPAGHQPPPQKCDAAVPQGAWLIEHPRERRGRVRVTAYDWQGSAPPPPAVIYRDAPPPPPPPGVIYRDAPPPPVLVRPPVLAVGEFDIANGVLLRVIVR